MVQQGRISYMHELKPKVNKTMFTKLRHQISDTTESKKSTYQNQLSCAMFPSPYPRNEWDRIQHPLLPELAKELAKLGCQCLATPERLSLKWLIRNKNDINVLHLHWPELHYCPPSSKFVSFINKAARRIKAASWLRTLYLPHFITILMVARVLRIPLVWTLHDLYPHGQTSGDHFKVDRIARKLLMRQVGALILNCHVAKPLATAEFGVAKYSTVAPLGNYAKFYPNTTTVLEARQYFGLESNHTVFLYFGSMRKHRNALSLIKAFKQISDQSIRLIVAGQSGPIISQEMKQAAKGDIRIQLFLELIPNDQIEYFFKACDFVVMPGFQYLTSAVIVLALSYGCPVIAPNYGCAINMIGQAGILYDEQEDLTSIIDHARKVDPQLYKQLASDQAKLLSWQNTASQTFDAYQKALSTIGKQSPHESQLSSVP